MLAIEASIEIIRNVSPHISLPKLESIPKDSMTLTSDREYPVPLLFDPALRVSASPYNLIKVLIKGNFYVSIKALRSVSHNLQLKEHMQFCVC